MTTKTTVEILREARAILETNGLWKGDFVDRDALEDDVPVEECPVCVYGALNLASGRDVDYDNDESVCAAELRVIDVFRPGAMAHSLSEWNDLPTTTLEDVLHLLDKAAAWAESPAEAAAVLGGAR